MKKSLLAVALTGLLAFAASAQAATVSFSVDRPIGLTDWTDSLALNKFDTSLGHLTSIKFTLTGSVSGRGLAENLDEDAPTSVLLNLASTVTLYRPDASTLVVTNPLFSQTMNLAAFDGNIDFAGPSGATTGLRTASATEFVISTSANDFALFSAQGGGLINLGISGAGVSEAIGSGNLASGFETAAGARATVTYNYAPVPEPETYAMMLTGLGLLAFARRRQAAKKLAA
jgi:hypothetical protein